MLVIALDYDASSGRDDLYRMSKVIAVAPVALKASDQSTAPVSSEKHMMQSQIKSQDSRLVPTMKPHVPLHQYSYAALMPRLMISSRSAITLLVTAPALECRPHHLQ